MATSQKPSDSLDKDSLKPLLVSLLKQNEELLEQVKRLLARIAELEACAGEPPGKWF